MTITVTVDYQKLEAHVESLRTHHYAHRTVSGVWVVETSGAPDYSTDIGFDTLAEAVGTAVQAAVEVNRG